MKTFFLTKKGLFFIATGLFAGSMLFLAGCSSDTSRNDDDISGNRIAVSFNVAGINEALSSSDNLNMASAAKLMSPNKTTSLGNGVDIVTSVEITAMGTQAAVKKTAVAVNTPGAHATTQPMASGKLFRVLVYEKNSGKYVGNIDQATGQTAVSLDLSKGMDYQYYAYSYNDTATLPPINDVLASNLQVQVANRDLLYATGTFTALIPTAPSSTANLNLAITFNHVMAKITLIVDARYVPADVNSVSNVSFNANYIQQGNFSLQTQNFSGSTPYNPQSNDFNLSITDPAIGTTVKSMVFYTIPSSVISNFGVTFGTMNIMDFNIPSNNAAPGSNYNFSFANVTPLQAYNANLRVILQKGGIIGDSFWASGNLWYDETAPEGRKYKIRPDDTTSRYTREFWTTDYWSWGGLTPTSNPSGGFFPNPLDVCLKVYPENTWRMATNHDIGNLVNTSNRIERVNNGTRIQVNNSNKWVQFNWDGEDPDYPIFQPTYGHYWVYSPKVNDPTFFKVAQYLSGVNYGETGGGAFVKRNIRCVRNN